METCSLSFRVVQKNLVFVVGLTQRLADPEVRVMSMCYYYYFHNSHVADNRPFCTIQSHGTKLHILGHKLHSGTYKTKAGQGGLVQLALF